MSRRVRATWAITSRRIVAMTERNCPTKVGLASRLSSHMMTWLAVTNVYRVASMRPGMVQVIKVKSLVIPT